MNMSLNTRIYASGQEPLYRDEWCIRETGHQEEDHQKNESLFALGNGYIGMRGNLEEGYHGASGSSVIGNYLNGFYDTEPIVYPEGAYGYPDQNHAMLNVPDAKAILLLVEGELFHLHTGMVLKSERILDMQNGMLCRHVKWESPAGHQVGITTRRLVSLEHKHLAAVEYEVTALNFSGSLSWISLMNPVVAGPEGSSDPRVGARRSEPSLLLEDSGFREDGLMYWMRHRTRRTRFALVTAMSHSLEVPGGEAPVQYSDAGQLGIRLDFRLEAGQSGKLTKFIAYHSSRDYPEEELLKFSREMLESADHGGFGSLAGEQRQALDYFWGKANIEIVGDPEMQQGVRFNAFGLLQSTGRDGMTNIAAKGLTGEGYEGHYFWDTEMYTLPFFTYTLPEIGRKLLEFRYRTLDKARERAAVMSQRGALYPWRTIAGEENSAYFPAGTAQVHINADICYGLQQYVLATGDETFLAEMGAEILFETSRFWVDLGHYNPALGGAFCIDAVTGPDEYTAIVNNNAYTNLMVQEQLRFACRTAERLRSSYPDHYERLKRKIGLLESEIADWKRAGESMYVPKDEGLGIYAQDDTFLLKKKWDFEGTPENNYPLLLHYHPLVIYRHQVLKQADLVMALFLLGDRFTMEEKVWNYRYYEPLTTHDSSLSPCIHSIVASEIGEAEEAYRYFRRTVRMDLDDVNKNAKDGLHTAAMAGAWMAVVQGFGGMRMYGDGVLSFTPALPASWNSLRFRVAKEGRLLEVFISHEEVAYSLVEGEALRIRHGGQEVEVLPERGVRLTRNAL